MSARKNVGDIRNAILGDLEENGYRAKIVPVARIKDIREDIETHRRTGRLHENVFRKWLTRFEFDPFSKHPEIKSVIIVAVPQPHVRLYFTHRGQSRPVIVPPTYSHVVDSKVTACMLGLLHGAGYRLFRHILPVKTLAVRSGLARYGKNNIVYVDGMGSYVRLKAYCSDMPCPDHDWLELKALDECQKCTACVKKCPTGAITPDRFLIKAERCLTFHNEGMGEFPDWIEGSWHHCLFGCLYCQSFCPVNLKAEIDVQDGAQFSEEETRLLMQGVSKDKLPIGTIRKLEEFGFEGDLPQMARNLKALLYGKGNIETGQALTRNLMSNRLRPSA